MLGFFLLVHSCDVVRARATCRIGILSVPWSPASVDGLPVVRRTCSSNDDRISTGTTGSSGTTRHILLQLNLSFSLETREKKYTLS